MSKIEQNVMGAVAAIYAGRLATSAMALKIYALLVLCVGIVFLVSVQNVFINLSHVAQGGVSSTILFIISAILGTTLIVQCVLALSAVTFISLFADMMRARKFRGVLA